MSWWLSPVKSEITSALDVSGSEVVARLVPTYWAKPIEELFRQLETTPNGLSDQDARDRLLRFGPNSLKASSGRTAIWMFLSQFGSPLTLILIFAASISAILREWSDALIIWFIILGSSSLSFSQEYAASTAVAKLRAKVSQKVRVLRSGTAATVAASDIVPGDVIVLSAGDLVPADAVVIECKDLFITQAALTGESFPVEKSMAHGSPDSTLADRMNVVFMGTSVRSGTARAVVVVTGRATEFGAIAEDIERAVPETDFARGIRRFGYLMSEVMLSIVLVVFVANLLLHRELVDSLLFSLALSVGLTPQLLPAIISVTLARGARRMSEQGVIVRQLASIENLGSMNVLCTDKTGTLTEGIVELSDCKTTDGSSAGGLIGLALLNAHFQTGLASPLDQAILEFAERRHIELPQGQKVDEVPYDFSRKRLSVVVRGFDGEPDNLIITKGAFANVLGICTHVVDDGRKVELDRQRSDKISKLFESWSTDGYRVLALATRRMQPKISYQRDDETGMILEGFLLFLDPPKPGVKEVLRSLRERGVHLKVITGDNRFVAAHLAKQVGLNTHHIVTGAELQYMTADALVHSASAIDLFVEVGPNQKEQIIAALQKSGHVVGYLGDGINDAPALHRADIGISVDQAVDVAKEAADIVLVRPDLDILRQGIDDGRTTFVNTLKYISIAVSGNFGNMISMAFASLVLPFLPLLAKQILLNNFLSDVPNMAIADDNVDRDLLRSPRRWDMGFVARFMITFGLISSLFDLLTFGFLLYVAKANVELFRTGWFVESMLTELAIVLVIRTHKPFYKSRPGTLLLASTVSVGALSVAMPYLPSAGIIGFVPLSIPVLGILISITFGYLVTSEIAKHWFFRKENRHYERIVQRWQTKLLPSAERPSGDASDGRLKI